jgi:hypothetical protein
VKRVGRRSAQQGAAAVEMAIILPFLVILLVGVTDVGWLIWKRIELQEAAQEGAIYFAYNPDDPAGARDRVKASTNADVKDTDFKNYPFCEDGGDETFFIELKHPLELVLTGRQVDVRVKVEGNILRPSGCP